jgi:hypothetical protein
VPLLALGYGAIYAGVMLLLNVGLVRLVPGWFAERQWTVGRQLAWTAMNLGLIGLATAVYTAGVGLAAWSLLVIARFTLFTVAVGNSPIALCVVLNESWLYRGYARRSETINEVLRGTERPPVSASGGLRIPAEGHAEDPNSTGTPSASFGPRITTSRSTTGRILARNGPCCAGASKPWRGRWGRTSATCAATRATS